MTGDRLVRRPLEWLIPGQIPMGRLTLLVGDTGVGKSTYLASLIAYVTAGVVMAGAGGRPLSRVLHYVAEEDVEGETLDRVEAAGADLSRWVIGDRLPDGRPAPPPHLPDRLAVLEERLVACRATLLILDPLTSYLSPGISVLDGQHVRGVLEPLQALTMRLGISTCITLHNRKSKQGGCLDWIAGSREWSQVPRQILAFGRDPRGGDGYVIAVAKQSRGRPGPAIGYRIMDQGSGPRLVLGDTIGLTAQDLGVEMEDDLERDARGDAQAYLRDVLDVEEARADMILARCSQAGISPRTLARAKRDMGVTSHLIGAAGDRHWVWRRPEKWPG